MMKVESRKQTLVSVLSLGSVDHGHGRTEIGKSES
jgi:GTPase